MADAFPRKWLQTSPVSQTPGAALFRSLEQELSRVNLLAATQSNNNNHTNSSLITPTGDAATTAGKQPPSSLLDLESADYRQQLRGVHRILADSMMSAVHRQIFHYHLNTGEQRGGAWRVAQDEEESHIVNDPAGESDDDDVHSQSSSNDLNGGADGGGHHHHHSGSAKKDAAGGSGGGSGGAGGSGGGAGGAGGGGGGGSGSGTAASQVDQKLKRREDAKKKRAEDEQLLRMKRVRSSEKSFLLNTLGPFPAPRLIVRSLKPGTQVPSRKLLNQRLQLDQIESSSSSTDEEEREALDQAASSSPAHNNDTETFKKLKNFLSPLSMDSLKKVSESAKLKLRAGCTIEEAVEEIAHAAVKQGCEKACLLMDRNKMLDKVATQMQTTRTHILAQLATNIPTFLGSLSPELLKMLGLTLGIPPEYVSVPEMWERVVAMGLCGVITHLRPRPLKKIAQEVSVPLNESRSTERQCEQIVFAIFPRERLRIRACKSLRRTPGVTFSLRSERVRCVEDMGFIGFNIHGISFMRGDAGERHYSPEFEFGTLKWSLLCMANKDNLALYLCQQGSVHCKFVISVVNHLNADDSVYNEGTQEFKASSSENDWGFNNVIKFDQLVDSKCGFRVNDSDSIAVDVGIVIVESTVAPPAAVNIPSATGNKLSIDDKRHAADDAAAGGGGGGNNNKHTAGYKDAGGDRQNGNKTVQAQQGGGGGRANNNGATNGGNGGGNGAAGAAAAGGGAAANANGGNNKRKPAHADANDSRASAAEAAAQLLELERVEAVRKRIKADIAKAHKDEDRLRKEFAAKCIRDLQQLAESCKRDEQRIERDGIEREKREQAERQREQERLRVAHEQHLELRRKLSELAEENAELAAKRKLVATETADLKAVVEAQRGQLAAADQALDAARAKLRAAQQCAEERRARLEDVRARIAARPPVVESAAQSLLAEDSEEIMRSVQQSLASIMDF